MNLDIDFGEKEQSADPVDTIFIAPPDPAIFTNEDSGDKDGVGDFDNLSKRHVLTDAEIRTVRGNIIGEALKEMLRTEVHSNILVRQQLQNHICLKNLNASHSRSLLI